MTFNDLRRTLAARLGDRGDLIDVMMGEYNLLQASTLERYTWTPWFLDSGPIEFILPEGMQMFPLPDDFLREFEGQAAWYKVEGGNYIPLKKVGFEELKARQLQNFPGDVYAVVNENLYLWPPVQQGRLLVLRYYKCDDTIRNASDENLWLRYAPDVALAELGVVFAEKYMQHFELGRIFRDDAAKAWNRLYTEHVSREEANLNRVMEV